MMYRALCPHCGWEIPKPTLHTYLAQMGGAALAAQRGKEYFRQLQARRKVRRGGRPRKRKEAA